MKKTLTVIIAALFSSAAIMLTACSGGGEGGDSAGGLFGANSNGTAVSTLDPGTSAIQSNPFAEPSAAQPSDTQPSYTQPSYTEPSYQPSYTQPSYTEPSYQPSAVMPSSTERSIREVLDSIGGTSALQQSVQNNISNANVQVSYNGDDQIVVNLVLKQTLDLNSAEGQQFVNGFHNDMPASIAPTITQIRQSTNARPFTFLMVVSNPDGTVLDQMVVSEDMASTTQTSSYIDTDPSYYYEPSDDDDDEPSYQPSAVMPSATERSIREVLDSMGGTSVLQQSVQNSIGTTATVEVSYNGDDQIVVKIISPQNIDPNSSEGQQYLSGFRDQMPASIAPTITQIRQVTNARPFTFLVIVANPDGTVIDQVVVSENG